MHVAYLDRHRIWHSSARVAVRLLAIAGAALSGVTACGASDLAVEYATYSAAVEKLLESESAVYTRWSKVIKLRQDDPAHPSYYALLQDDAVPFYAELVNEVGALETDDPRITAAHEHLIAFASARYEFASLELQARSVNERARDADGGLLDLLEAQARAEAATNEYMAGVAGDVPDYRHSQLAQLVGDFQNHQLSDFEKGTVPVDRIQATMRRHLLPKIEELRASRLPEGAQGRRLSAEFDAWAEYFRLFDERAPLFQELMIAASRSTHAATEALEENQKFLDALEAVRRER